MRSLAVGLALVAAVTSTYAQSDSLRIALRPEDSTPVDSTTKVARSERLTPEEYRFAGGPRYTISGALPFRTTTLQPIEATVTATALTGALVGIHIYQQNAWWKDNRTSFHFYTDWGYAAQADKIGHLLACNFVSYIAHESLVSSGVSHSTAAWLAPTIGLAFSTYVEIEDGFAGWGFDPTDQVANSLGALLFAGQQYLPWLQNAQLKWSYWPTDHLNKGEIGHKTIVVDDYNGQTAWVSFKMGNILPESLGWPKWLRLAAGYAATNVDNWRVNPDGTRTLLDPERRLFIALDYDLVEIVPDIGSFGNWMVQTLDYLHLPSPALQLLPELKFELLYPIHF